MIEKQLIIGLCGGSGSGKSSLVQKIVNELNVGEFTILSMDDYYFNIEQQKKDENGFENFDLPTAIDINRIIEDIKKLKNGEVVELDEYTFNNPEASAKTKILKPNKIIIVEGIFLLYFHEVLELLDFSVYIDVDLDQQLKRRIKRDVKTRGYSEKQIKYQWEHHVLPCFTEYIKPYIKKADVVVDNNVDFHLTPILDKIHISTV